MHDLIRDMVINMMDGRFMVKAELHLSDVPHEKEWSLELEKVSLMHNQIKEVLPYTSPICPELSAVLLCENPLEKISDQFFIHMPTLQILDLSNTNIETLPDSVCNLTRLVALYLRGCRRLQCLPSLAKLQELRTLDLSFSEIKTVPHGMERLSNLRFLNFGYSCLEELPLGILPQISHLQYLYLLHCKVTVQVTELRSLRKLEVLKCHFQEISEFNACIEHLRRNRSLQCYELHLGYYTHDIRVSKPRAIVLRSCQVQEKFLLPENVLQLSIEDIHDIRSPSDLSSLPLENFRHLKKCEIFDCGGMECLISLSSSDSSSPHCTIFPSLEHLSLFDLPEFRVLVEESSAATSVMLPHVTSHGMFSTLKNLHISSCPEIKTLLTPLMLPNLINLESIHVELCEQMQEIVSTEGIAAESNFDPDKDSRPTFSPLPKLKFLWLRQLPELKNILGRTNLTFGSIQNIAITKCHNVKRIPLHLQPLQKGASSLSRIEITKDDISWWQSLEWDGFDATTILEPYLLVHENIGIMVSDFDSKEYADSEEDDQ